MSLIQWDEKLSVGIPSIDAQHQRLVALINSFHEALAAGRGREVIDRVLGDLVSYTQVHFTFEELLMKRYGYPGLSSHAALHADFTAKVREMLARPEAGKPVVVLAVHKMLRDWLVQHIRGEDQKYAALLVESGAR